MDFNAFFRDLIAKINFFLYDLTLFFRNITSMLS